MSSTTADPDPNPEPEPKPAHKFKLPPRDPAHHPVRLLAAAAAEGRPLYVQAPMVRYSKLPFRSLVRTYSCDLCYTPMLLAKEFIRSSKARECEFTTSCSDRPLVVQFAASNALDFGRAAEMVAPYCDGVDLNCGCPQSWAIHDGVGCAMLQSPALVAEMVAAAKTRCGPDFCISVKIRLHKDLAQTLSFVRAVEEAGVDYITVHGRTRSQRSSEPVNLAGIATVKKAARVPIIANGDIFHLHDAHRIAAETGVDGVMAARGLMKNPALFAGFEKTPWGAVERFMAFAMNQRLHYRLLQHHVVEMMDDGGGGGGKNMWRNRKERVSMLGCTTVIELIEWIDERFVLRRPEDEGFGEAVEADRHDVT